MSYVGSYQTKIVVKPKPKYISSVTAENSDIEENPCLEILRLAINAVARDYECSVENFVVDYHGRRTDCDFALKPAGFVRGVGIKIAGDGHVSFVYDDYAADPLVPRAICDQVTQNYVAIATMRALRELGYRIHEEERGETTGNRDILVRGVKM